MKLIFTLSQSNLSKILQMLLHGIKFIEHPQKEVLFIYQIFMLNLFSLLLNVNLFLSFLKRKIKIFKSSPNSNSNSNSQPPLGHGYLKSFANMNLFKNTFLLLQIDPRSLKTGSKVKSSLFNALKIVFVTSKT